MKKQLPQSKILSLEGAPFAGKTTILNDLKANHAHEVIVIPEASEYIGGDKNNPSFPFENFKDAKASTHFFLELEKQRCKDAIDLARVSQLPVILDRSTPIFSLIFYSLIEDKYPGLHLFSESFFAYAQGIFQKAIFEEEIFLPSRVIYIKPANQEVFLKRLSRGTKNGLFAEWENFLYVDNYYKEIIKRYYLSQKEHRVLVSENTLENLHKNVREVIKFAKEDAVIDMKNSDMINSFLGKENKEFRDVLLLKEQEEFLDTRVHCMDLINQTKEGKSV
jgi:hypothetical protein